MVATIAQELRAATRIGVRTPVIVYCQDTNGQLVRSRAWTDDLSSIGARITTERPLAGKRFFIRVMLPDFKDRIFSCEIVREIDTSRESYGGKIDVRRGYYGIRFLDLAEEEDVAAIARLDQAILQQTTTKG